MKYTYLSGNVNEPVVNYDKMEAIIIYLNDDGMEARSDIIRLLSTLFSTTQPVEKRKEILENEFHIPMTKEIEEGMQEMCNLGSAIEYYGRQAGIQTGRMQMVMSTMKAQGWDVDKTLDIMGVDMKERPFLAASVRAELKKQADARKNI